MQEVLDAENIGNLMVYILEEVDNEKVSKMTKEMVDFGIVVSTKD